MTPFRSFTVEIRCPICGAQITDQHLRAARADLAVIRCRWVDDALIRSHEANVGIARPAIGVGTVPGVAGRGRADRRHRHFGRTINARNDGTFEILLRAAYQLRRSEEDTSELQSLMGISFS